MSREKYVIFFWTTLTVIFGGLLPDAMSGASLFHEWRGAPPWPLPIRIAIGIAILIFFLISANRLWEATEQLLPVKKIRKCDQKEATIQCILMTPSPLDRKKWEFDHTGTHPTMRLQNSQDTAHLLPENKIREHIDALWQLDKRGPNWIQLLRAIEPHLDTLQEIVLLTTKRVHENHKELEAFLSHCCMGSLGSKKPAIRITPLEDNGDDMVIVYEKTNSEIKRLLNEGFNEDSILLDITGAGKPASVAMSLSTLHHPKIKLQYVPNDASLNPVCYEVSNPSIGQIN